VVKPPEGFFIPLEASLIYKLILRSSSLEGRCLPFKGDKIIRRGK
jgi:hypothetical protein